MTSPYLDNQYKYVNNVVTITATTEESTVVDSLDIYQYVEDVDDILVKLHNMKLEDPLTTIENIEKIIGEKFEFILQVY